MENISDTADESFLRWRISIEENDYSTDLEEYGSEPLLKTVVRTSYLYHLRQSLRKNLEASKQTTNYAVEEAIVNKVIKGCSALLEEKALRHCMIAKLYQRMMAQTIKDVKKSTSESVLFSSLKEFAEHQSRVPTPSFVHKEVQTEAIVEQPVDSNPLNLAETNLDERIQSFLKNTIAVKSFPVKLNGALHEKSSNRQKSVTKIQSNRKAIKRKNPEVNKNVSGSSDEENVNEVNIPVFTNLKTAEAPAGVINKSNVFEVRLKSQVFAESVAMWYSLECEIEDLPINKKQKLETKFVQIFGADHAVDYYGLTDEQKSLACRKRIAKFVVAELTCYYAKKRIASKQLFKTLAKHITSMLLERSLYPSSEEVKRSVEEFFLQGKVINSEEDFYF